MTSILRNWRAMSLAALVGGMTAGILGLNTINSLFDELIQVDSNLRSKLITEREAKATNENISKEYTSRLIKIDYTLGGFLLFGVYAYRKRASQPKPPQEDARNPDY